METLLTHEEINNYEEAIDLYEQREAQVREFIYGTVDPNTLIQIKGKSSAEVWKKLVVIHAMKGDMLKTDLLNKLQTIRYTDGDDMRTHLGTMKALHECLAETGPEITDNSFNTHIRTSLSLTTHYRPLFTTLDTSARVTKSKISSTDLIWHITVEYNNAAMEESINQSNATIGKGNLKIKLPTCSDQKAANITLKGVYYAPSMAFTLISVSCLDRASCSAVIKDVTCVIRGAHPE